MVIVSLHYKRSAINSGVSFIKWGSIYCGGCVSCVATDDRALIHNDRIV